MCELSVGDERQQSEQNEGEKLVRQLGQLERKLDPDQVPECGTEFGTTEFGDNSWMQTKLTGGHNIWNSNWRDNLVCNKLTDHSIQSVVQAVVRSDKRCRRITFGVYMAVCSSAGTASSNTRVQVFIGTRKREHRTRPLASLLRGMTVDVQMCEDF